MEIKIHFKDYSFVQVECDDSIFYELREQFSFESEGYQFNPRFKYSNWDGRICLLDYERNFPIGLTKTLIKFAQAQGYKVTADPKIFAQTKITRKSFDEWVAGLDIYAKGEKISPHWYQMDSVFKGITDRRALLNLPTSAGKAQPLDRKILTPSGWSTMGDMKVGSVVLTPEGEHANVIAVHPQGVKRIYEITFKDGRKTQCCGEHLWRVFSHDFSKRDGHWRVMSLNDIMGLDGKRTRYIQTPCIEYPEKPLPIDPYLLGALIGDGSLSQRQKTLTSMDLPIVERCKKGLPNGLTMREIKDKKDSLASTYNIVCDGKRSNGKDTNHPMSIFKQSLESLGVCTTSYNKKIPDEYKTASVEQRKELLRGLIDTDGTIDKNGGMSFATVSIELANDVVDIVRSIGGFASLTTKKTNSDFGLCYNVSINHEHKEELCTLDRKLRNLGNGSRFNSRLAITSIVEVDEQEAQCITLDTKEHLYVTDDYIVTHNSLIQCLLCLWFLEQFESKVLIIVPTTTLVTQMKNDFVDYGLFPAGAIQEIRNGVKEYYADEKLITVSTWQSACKKPAEWFLQFGMLMVDECHLSTGKTIKSIVEHCTHIPFKFGLSGSLRDGKANIMQYVGMFGDVFRPVTTKQLMDDGQVTKLNINAIMLRYTDEEALACKKLDYQNEVKFITDNKRRIIWMCKLAKKLADRNENVFLMFKHKKYGDKLYKVMQHIHGEDKVHFIDGDVKTNDRTAMSVEAENVLGHVYVVSYGTMSTGVSIKNLHHAIFAQGVKSKITVIQSIGRTLRKHKSKAIAQLWDICDDLGVKPKTNRSNKKYTHMNYALKHALGRIERYASEQFDYKLKEVKI